MAARVANPPKGSRDLVLARAVLTSATAKRVRLVFGYSDAVRIFLNGRLLFEAESRFRSRDPGSLSAMAERLLTDTVLRDRLVAEASEHVLTFDWADVARQVGAVYRELVRPPSLRSG